MTRSLLQRGRATARAFRGRMPTPIQPFLTTRFIKFCAVGASGVVVNLGCLAAFVAAFGMRSSIASAWAIELSIISNFIVNERWTFADQRAGGGALGRAVRFQLVSFVGAAVQWVVFVIANVLWLRLLFGAGALDDYLAGTSGFIEGWILRPIQSPPEVGHWIYVSQLAGIAVATGWNYLANFHWTWGGPKG